MRTMYDSTNPAAIPPDAQMVAGYVNGPNSQWPHSGWDRFPHAVKIRIDVGVPTPQPLAADVADLENGNFGTDGSPAALAAAGAAWVKTRQARGWWSTLYCDANLLPAVRDACRGLHVYYWIANWDLAVPQAAGLIGGDVVAVQWASPTSNGLPDYDLSVVSDSWFPPPAPPVPAPVSLKTQIETALGKVSADVSAVGQLVARLP